MKKKEAAKKKGRATTRKSPAGRAPALKSPALAARTHPSPPRGGGDGNASAVPASLIHQLEKRLEHNAHQFEDAKKRFEKAARARVATPPHGPQHQIQKDLTEFGLEMRLLTARRSELLWLQQLLGPTQG